MELILNEASSFYGFTQFIYVVREADGYKIHIDLISGITFSDQYNDVEILDVKQFDEDNYRFYTSFRISIASCRLVYCDKHNKKKNARAASKDQL